MIDIVYDESDELIDEYMQQNGELFVPPSPSSGFLYDKTSIPFKSEILQSFSEMTHITLITFHPYYQPHTTYLVDYVTYQIDATALMCENDNHHVQCVVPNNYSPWYI